MNAQGDVRWIRSGETIPVSVLRDFLLQALRHDAISDELIEWMVILARQDRLHEFLAGLLPTLVDDVLGVVVKEDWKVIADALIGDVHDDLLEEAET
jgi:hypothetical protein